MRSWSGNAARRQMLNGALLAVLLPAIAATVGSAAWGQLTAPRYQGPGQVEAPTPQLILPTPPPAVTANGTVVEYPIVRVNDQIIDNSDYDRAQQKLLEEAQQNNLTPVEVDQRQKDLLRDLIDEQLLLSRGKELEVNPDAEVIRRLDDLRKQNHLDSMEDLEKAVRESGISFEDFKANIKNSVITQQVVRDEVGRTLRMTARDEQAYYDQHKEDFQQPEQIRLGEILVPTPEDATDAQIALAQAKADEVAAKLKAGSSFDDLAKQYSGGPNPDKGGDLGQFQRGALAKVLEDQTFALKAGEFTAPIRTRQGYVVLKVTEHTPAQAQPLTAVEEQVQEALYERAIQPALRTYLLKLRENAFIDVAPGFVDTGASPKQTKPVFSGATTLPVKTKKVQQKARLENARAATAKTSAAAPVTGAQPANTAALQTNSAPAAKQVSLATSKKPRKLKREKIRYGQAPRNSLPVGPEEAPATGADQGPGATASALPAPGEAIAPLDQSTNVASNVDPLAPAAPQGKTRFSDRAATIAQAKAAVKAAKVQRKVAAKPAPPTPEEIAVEKARSAPLGLNGDTAARKKTKKVKGAPKERIQEKPPAPPAPKPDATPIPPKSVRDNGEPVVTPAPALPPATAPAPAAQ